MLTPAIAAAQPGETVLRSVRVPFPRAGVLFLLVLSVGFSGRASAQATAETDESGLFSADRRAFFWLYENEAPALSAAMYAADFTAYPVFAGAVPATWLAVRLGDERDYRDVYYLFLSESLALAGVTGIKYLVRRPRPYVRWTEVTSRTGEIADFQRYAFPSGHAALAFAVATSWTLSHPRWYVAVPGYLWAATVAASRVWLGVHYPSDVVAGALLGAGVAVAVHALGPTFTPGFLTPDERPDEGVSIVLRIGLY